MRHARWVPAALVLGVAAGARSAVAMPGSGTGAPPRLVAEPLMVGDGTGDRGFPGGVSLVDVDGDGDLDLMATGGYCPIPRAQEPYYTYRPNLLYLNDGAGDFTHSPEAAFAAADHPFSGSTWGDVDDDGDLDAFVATQHGQPDVFYRNLGGGHFAREELGDATRTPGSNFAESWVDIDGDGDLDLMSGGPTMERGGPLLVYRNDAGTFTRVTGVAIENGPVSNAGAILWADFDSDGDPDLFVANTDLQRVNAMTPATLETPQYYRNDGNWSFVRTEGQGFDDREYAATSAACGDLDNDGDLDLYLGHFGYGNSGARDHVFLNDGHGRFTLDPRFEGHVHPDRETFSVTLVDLDLDGDLDLLTTAYSEGPRLLVNDGAGVFTPVEDEDLLGRTGFYSGAASGDLDGDGDLDVVLGSWGETTEGDTVTLLRNESEPYGTPLVIQLRSRAGAPDPLGARVTLVTRGPAGERRQLREASGQSTFRSQSADPFHFGVPRGEHVVEAVVRWPDGTLQHVRELDPERRNVVRAGAD